MRRFDVDDGEVIRLSLRKVVVGLLFSCVWVLLGVGLLVLCVAMVFVRDARWGPGPFWMMVSAAIVGVCWLVMGGIMIATGFPLLLRSTRWVLGERYLQQVAGHSEVVVQIPWDNISDVQFMTEIVEDQEVTFVGIRAHNPRRSDTRISRSGAYSVEGVGFDCLVDNFYVRSAEGIYDLICERHAKTYRRSATLQDGDPIPDDRIPRCEPDGPGADSPTHRPERNPPKAGPPRRKRRRKNRSANDVWIAVGAAAVLLCFLLGCLIVVLVFFTRQT